ncbi:MAG: hypothetical protein V1867_03905 [Candidatus Falkowbacteria bacterium]
MTTNQELTVTKKAVDHLKAVIRQRNLPSGKSIRIYLQTSG